MADRNVRNDVSVVDKTKGNYEMEPRASPAAATLQYITHSVRGAKGHATRPYLPGIHSQANYYSVHGLLNDTLNNCKSNQNA